MTDYKTLMNDYSEDFPIISKMYEINCKIMENGLNPCNFIHYFCSCDPDSNNPICEECKEKCHVGEGHIIGEAYEGEVICSCGLKCHRLEINEQQNGKRHYYYPKCYYYEASYLLKEYYELNNKKICLFCNFVCEENINNIKIQNFIEDINNSVDDKLKFSRCDCENALHQDIRSIFKRINLIIEKYQGLVIGKYEGIRALNILSLCEKSFNNLFGSFILGMKYFKDDQNFQIDKNLNNSNFLQSLIIFSNIASFTKSFYISNKDFNNIFNINIVIKLLKTQIENDKVCIIVRSCIYTCFQKFIFNRYFSNYLDLEVSDLINMTPIQRFLIIQEIRKNNKIREVFLSLREQKNFIDILIIGIENFIKYINNQDHDILSNEENNLIYRITLMIKIFCKYYLLSKDQIIKYVFSAEKLLIKLIEKNNNLIKTKKKRNYQIEEMKIFKNIIKSFYYILFFINDNIIINHISNKDLNQDKSFEYLSEIIDIVNKKDVVNDEDTKSLEIEKLLIDTKLIFFHIRDNVSNISKYVLKSTYLILDIVNSHNSNNNFENESLNTISENMSNDSRFKEVIKEITSDCISLLSYINGDNDFYLNGLKIMTQVNTTLGVLFNIYSQLENNINSNEYIFYSKLNDESNKLQDEIYNFYIFISNSEDVIKIFIKSIKSIFEIMLLEDFNLIGNNESENLFNNEGLIDDSIKINEEDVVINNEKYLNKMFPSYNSTSFKYRIILMKSNYINILLKIIYVLNISNQEKKYEGRKNSNSFHNNFDFDQELIYQIFRMLNFFIINSPDNSIYIISNDILRILNLLNSEFSIQIFDLIVSSIEILIKFDYSIPSLSQFISSIYSILLNSKKSIIIYPHCLDKFLKILKLIISKFENIENTKIIPFIRVIVIDIYNQEIYFMLFKKFLLEISKSSEDANIIYENYLSEYKRYLPYRLGIKIYYKFLYIINHIFDDSAMFCAGNDFTNSVISAHECIQILKKLDLDLKLRSQILTFFRICYIDLSIKQQNKEAYMYLFSREFDIDEENIIKNEDLKVFSFLENIINMSYDANLFTDNIEYEIILHEIIHFKDILYSNEDQADKDNNDFETKDYYKNLLYKKNSKDDYDNKNELGNDEYIDIDISPSPNLNNLYSNEVSGYINLNNSPNLKPNFNKLTQINKFKHIKVNKRKEDLKKKQIQLYYIENGILFPLKIFLNKMFTLACHMSGNDFIKIYKLLYNFLLLKKKILQMDILKEIINEEEGSSPVFSRKDSKLSIASHVSSNKLKHKKTLHIIKPNRKGVDIKEVDLDVTYILDSSFQPLNYIKIYQIFNKHLFSMIEKPKTFILNGYIPKSRIMQSNKEDIIKERNLLKNHFNSIEENYFGEKNRKSDNKILYCQIIKAYDCFNIYKLTMRRFYITSLKQTLTDLYSDPPQTYRRLLIKCLFFLSTQKIYENDIHINIKSYLLILSLLNSETGETQQAIRYIRENLGPSYINLDSLGTVCFNNIMSIIFTQYNPSSFSISEDYVNAINIIKLFKYLCEEHNIYFQNIICNEIKFTISSSFQLSLFDLMLFISEKINLLSGWEKIIHNHGEFIINSIDKINENEFEEDFYYPLFKILTDFLIEVVQGSSKNNFKSIYNVQEPIDLDIQEIIRLKELKKKNTFLKNTPTARRSQRKSSIRIFNTIQTKNISNKKLITQKKSIQNESIKGLPLYLKNIKGVLFNDTNDSNIIYKARTDIALFILSFLEENNCNKSLKKLIIDNIPADMLFKSIQMTLKKLYYKLKLKLNDSLLKSKNFTHFIEHEKINKEKFSFSNEINLYSRYIYEIKDNNKSKGLKFNKELYDFFLSNYFKNEDLSEMDEFKLCLIMFSIFKIYSIDFPESVKGILSSLDFLFNNPNKIDIFTSEFNKISNASNNYCFESIFKIKSEKLDNIYLDTLESNKKHDGKDEIKHNDNNTERLFDNDKRIETDQNNVESEKKKENIEKKEEKMEETNVNENTEKGNIDINSLENFYIIRLFEPIVKSISIKLQNNNLHNIVFITIPGNQLISKNSKSDFLKNINRENQFTKLSGLITESEYFLDEIYFTSVMINKSFLYKLSSYFNYHKLNRFIYFWIVFLNILLHVFMGKVEFDKSDTPKYIVYIISIITYFAIIFSVIVLIVWSITSLPLSYSTEIKKKLLYKKIYSTDFNLSIYNKIHILIFKCLLFNKDIIVFFMIVMFGLLGFSHPYYYGFFSFMLLGVIFISDSFKNIVLSFYEESRQLLLILAFEAIIIFVYAIISFFFLARYFTIHGQSCTSLLGCFLDIFNNSYPKKTGIQLLLSDKSLQLETGIYWLRYFYDVLFFYFFATVMPNYFLGILLDSFNIHRHISQKKEFDIANVCFICGGKKDEFEKENIDFVKHKQIHNIWDYISYLIFIRKSNEHDLNSNNAYVKQKINERSISFFPIYKSNKNENDNYGIVEE